MDMTTGPSARTVPSRSVEALVLAAAAVVVAAAGAPLGLLWSALSGRVPMVMTGDGAMYDPETETFAGADVRFVLITAGAGLVAAVLCWIVLRRYRGPLVLAVLGVGGFGSALLAAWVGSRVGLADYQYLLGHAEVGWRFGIPLQLAAHGAYAAQPLAGVLLYTVFAGCSRFPALRATATRRSVEPPVPELVEPVRLPLTRARVMEAPAESPAPPAEPDVAVPGVAWPDPPAAQPPAAQPPAAQSPAARPPAGQAANGDGRPTVADPADGTEPPPLPPAPPGPVEWPDAPDRHPE
ncbi:DUF2567 domain-containing protein [Actinocatenispora rupis]|nr:DUF2567 domain-containing protein [Actinocatenispora rupis]